MKIGYARVSSIEQNLDEQILALKMAGADPVFSDEGVSGGAVFKEKWLEAKALARPGDELIVWRLDRLARSFRDLIDELDLLKQAGFSFRSLEDNIESAADGGQPFFKFVGALAQFERDIAADRAAEIEFAASIDQNPVGRPPTISDDAWSEVESKLADGSMSAPEAARQLGISRQAVHKRIKRAKV